MSGERLARVTLALDAIWCASVGLLLIVFRARLGGLLRVPGLLVAAIGAAAAGSSFAVLGQTVRIDWRRGIKQMVATNSLVAAGLALAAAIHPARGGRALLAFTALDAMALAAAQAISLLSRRKRG